MKRYNVNRTVTAIVFLQLFLRENVHARLAELTAKFVYAGDQCLKVIAIFDAGRLAHFHVSWIKTSIEERKGRPL